SGLLPRELAVIGVARQDLTTEEFRQKLNHEIREFATDAIDAERWDGLQNRLYYIPGEFADPATYSRLSETLDEVGRRHGTGRNAFYYLAASPSFFGEIVRQLGQAGLVREAEGGWRRVIVEKPFGRDLDSARALNRELGEVLGEHQT